MRLRPGLLVVAVAAGAAVFAWGVVTAPPPTRGIAASRNDAARSLRGHFVAGRWQDLYASAETALESAGERPDVRLWAMLFRAWAAERLELALEAVPPDPSVPAGAPADAEAAPIPAVMRAEQAWTALRDALETEVALEGDAPGGATAASASVPALNVRDRALSAYFKGWASRGLGDEFTAQRLWREAAELQRVAADQTPYDEEAYLLSNYLALIGERDAAVDWLARASARDWLSRSGLDVWARVDPDLDGVRDHPRYELALLGPDRFGASVRRLVAEGRRGDAAWLAQTLAHGADLAEAWQFVGMLFEGAEGDDERRAARHAFRTLLERHRATTDGASPEDMLAGLPPPGAVLPNVDHEIGWALRGLGHGEASRAYFSAYVASMRALYDGALGEGEGPRTLDGAAAGHAYNLACGLALVGDAGGSLEALRAAFRHGYRDLDWALEDPDLAALSKSEVRASAGAGVDGAGDAGE